MQEAIAERNKKYFFLNVDRAFPAISEFAEVVDRNFEARREPLSTLDRYSNPDSDPLLSRIAFLI